ncbi:MAG: 4Fe-4S binding protein [Bacillota bacterium]
MKIAVLSGKGGAGKTFIAVNLANVMENSLYADCDVEEPNGHLFFKNTVDEKKDVAVKIPKAEAEKCIGCKECVEFCKFNALAYTKSLIVFDDICHSCGGCKIVCPQNAIYETLKVIGSIEKGRSQNTLVVTGTMKEGVASGVPIINEIVKKLNEISCDSVIDCPPGSACVVMESIKDADFCILVAEPTVFSSHNLNMVYELVKLFNKPMGVVLNKDTNSFNSSEALCNEKGIKILEKIPYDKELAHITSQGEIASRKDKVYFELFYNLYNKVKEEVGR